MAQPSLFGPSVAEAQLAIEQQDQQNVRQGRTGWAGVADIGITSAQRAARSLGGLFGIEDPRLKEAAQQEAIFKELKDSGVDFTDSEKLYPALINAYQSRGMIDKAIVAAAKYEDVKSTSLKTQAELGLKGAQTEKALAEAAKAQREKLDTPFGKVDPDKFTPESLDKFRETGNYADLVAKPDKAKAPPSVGTDREAVSLELYNKNFMDLTQPERVAVNKRVEEAAKSRQTTNVVLNTPQTAALVAQGQQATKPIFERVQSIDRSISLIDQNTPFSEAALRQEIASIFGDSQKAATEIRGLANTGSLDERIANRVVNFVSGKDTKVTNEDRKAVLLALRKREQEQYERRLTPFRQAIKTESGANPNAIFPSFEEAFGTAPGSTTGKRKTKSGTEYTVE
jgi:hypothetical protein